MSVRRGLAVLVADDEPLARRRLCALLERRPDVARIVEAADGDDARSRIGRGDIDVAFLDIQMPGCDGLTVARAIGQAHLPVVVFVTAFERHAVTAFELEVVDYLLKPFDDERFATAFGRARRRVDAERLAAQSGRTATLSDAADASLPVAAEHITVEKAGRLDVLPLAEVDWVRAADNYVELFGRGVIYLVRATLTQAAARLPSPPFLRIHRSAIVNAGRIDRIETQATGQDTVVMRSGTRLPLSRRYRRRLPRLDALTR